jgi:PQQ-dependent catabolism-associated CXXCW motif protein
MMDKRARFTIACACALFGSLAALADEAPPEPESYRIEEYRAPTPATLKGARVLTTAEAQDIWRRGAAVFVDVLPQAPRPANLAPEIVWRDKPRLDIPGSVWLPDTGYGALAPNTEAYFGAGLRKATGNDPGKAIVFYCLRNCWMSWNAAKRAQALGYRGVDWYPEGTDGWAAAGLPLEARSPEPRP